MTSTQSHPGRPSARPIVADECRKLLLLQQHVLEGIAGGSPRDETLELLCRVIDEMVPSAAATVMELGDDGELRFIASPGVPESACRYFVGMQPGAGRGNCAAAVHTGEPVYATDTATDESWGQVRHIAAALGIRSCWSVPIKDPCGAVLGSFGISHFVPASPTEFDLELLDTARYLAGIAMLRHRQEQELARTSAKMQQRQKLESLGLVAGGLAHDFNNLLTVVLGNVDVATAKLDDAHPAREALVRIETAATRCSQVCSQMLAYAGKGKLHPEPSDLSALTAEVTDLLETTVSATAQIDLQLDPDLPSVAVDSTQLTQVILNLITNATEACEGERGRIRVATGHVRIDGTDSATRDLAAGDYAFVEVRDDGVGMDENVLQRIFDPFYSTKIEGRGLGLSAARGIARSHGGDIMAESTIGAGTRMRVVLPFLSDSAAATIASKGAQPNTPAPTTSNGRGRTVLVIDDEELVRNVAGDVLAQDGARPLLAANSDQALHLLREHPQIDTVLLDLTMPDTPGDELLPEILALRPEMPVIVCTGLSERDAAQRLAGQRIAGMLYKPFRAPELRKCLAAIQ